MTKEKIREVYTTYRNMKSRVKEIEDSLLVVANQDDWIRKLSQKSTFLRMTYHDTETLLDQFIRPIIKHEYALTYDIAKELLTQVIDMETNTEIDSLMTTEVLKVLIEFFSENSHMDEEILATFFLAISYADKCNTVQALLAFECFDKVCSFASHYCEISDWDIRRRIIYAFYNRLTNFDLIQVADNSRLISLWQELCAFYNREDVRALDGERFDFDEFLEECTVSLHLDCICTDAVPSQEILDFIREQFISENVTENELLSLNSSTALCYIWYYYWTQKYDCNKALSMIYCYYREKDKEIDYSQIYFYDTEEYQIQMVFMQECFRFLARPDCTHWDKPLIWQNLIADFTRLYKSVPYLDNNAFINNDMIEIMSLMLRSVTKEDEAFTYIKDVVIRRNAMTLIHSTMVSQISERIVKSLIKNAPEVFFDMLSVNSPEDVEAQSDYLTKYINNISYIHDIGKIIISDVINLQTRKLTEEEFSIIKNHPAFGANIIEKTILEERYKNAILGHHVTYDGTAGYPESFFHQSPKEKVLIDILTISDCIDAATDMLGRNYTTAKTWIPVVQDELMSDNSHRYNEQIVNAICRDQILCDEIQYLTGLGRVGIYYSIFQTYLT